MQGTGKPKSVIVAWSDASERLGSAHRLMLLVSHGFVGIKAAASELFSLELSH